MKYVQIENGKVVTVFCCPQDPDSWPGYAEVEDDDERYLAYMKWLSTLFPQR